jgi:MoCo/4Fe-4S cofactor protein with predicted Tat translocation signal
MRKYWQSFGELNKTENFQQSAQNEFKEELLPLADLDDKGILEVKTPRRDFLKYLGFSTAAAAVAASCDTPVRKSVPFLNKPDNVIPGIANYYASTYINGGDAVAVVVKQRDGRPIKIEGNELSSITKGGTSAQVQASVLDLYDVTRLRYPMQSDGKEFKEVSTFDNFDKMVGTALAGKAIVLLTGTINSPSTLQVIAEFIAKYPGSRHVQYDAVSHGGMILANEACYGKRALPSYHFDNAKIIVSLGADFLGTWLSPVEFSKQYAANRKINAARPELSRHIQFESMLSMTGSNADDRYTHKPSETGAVALALLAKLGGGVTAPALNATLQKAVDKTAAELAANKGAGLVVCGSNDVNVQMIVNAINEAIGAGGKTINWGITSNYRKGVDADMVKLTEELNAGTVNAVLVYGANPVYAYPEKDKLVAGLKKAVTVSFNITIDETAELCKYILPSHHWLESFGDAEPKTNHFSFMQPAINPLFKTRAFQTSLLKWSGSTTPDYEVYLKNYWITKLGTEAAYLKVLQDGISETPAPAVAAAYSAAKVADAAAKIAAVKGGEKEVVLYQKISIGNGSQANNPWLQELPDPITKATWDNYAMVSPVMYKELFGKDVLGNVGDSDAYEVNPQKPVIKITVGKASVELPVMIIPGVNDKTIAVAVGYGRSSNDAAKTEEYIGKGANGAGKNAYPLAIFDGSTFVSSASAVVEKTGNTYPLAITQVHGSSENRPVIYETTLARFLADPKEVLKEPREERENLMPYQTGEEKEKATFEKDATIYPQFDNPGIKWGMNIDLNTCTGCSACVVACTAENNVSVVGKKQVQKYHEMHWLRIDRYFTGDMNNPDVVFQPMLCQHCDNAPCENVCPVNATNHSSEGLNQMTYNRCIGTRYCANNCPYKVRRFNWLDFTGADSFPDNQSPLIKEGGLDNVIEQMNDDLTRMVLNPDVTVRSRGVIEKCSFCVQRLQENKLAAKKAQDPVMVRNVKTACMQACPTNAISFGNVNDKESDVYKIRNTEQKDRNFYVLESLHVLPNVSYLAKVKNTDRQVTNEKEAHEAAGEKKEVKKEAAHA